MLPGHTGVSSSKRLGGVWVCFVSECFDLVWGRVIGFDLGVNAWIWFGRERLALFWERAFGFGLRVSVWICFGSERLGLVWETVIGSVWE